MTASTNLPAVEIAFRTDPGRDPDKQVNEDGAAHVETRLGLLCVVCDGMGGHAGGKEASELAVQTILEIIQAAPEITSPREALRVAIEEANRRIWSMPVPGGEGGYRPGSTVVAILAHAGGADVAHVGDSRIYLVHAGAITQVTKDHSMVQEMVDRNIIRAEDAAKHPDANKIMRALGIAKEVEVDVRSEPIAFVTGDVFVLCTDGLSDLVSPAEILEIASRPPAQASGQLVDFANARGGHDNITAMIVRMKSSATHVAAPTIVKTVQFTAHEVSSPPEAGGGPGATVLTAPLAEARETPATVPFAPAQPPADARTSAPSGAGPSAQAQGPAHHPPDERRPSRLSLGVGLGLALIAIALLAVLLWIANKPKNKHPPYVPLDVVVDASAASAPPPEAAEPDEDPVEITPAPPLSGSAEAPSTFPTLPPPTTWRRDGGVSDVCARARSALARHSPAAPALEAQCRAQGGEP